LQKIQIQIQICPQFLDRLNQNKRDLELSLSLSTFSLEKSESFLSFFKKETVLKLF